ncbi:MAG TPA: glycine cleavage system aminomethyltransferase GcvT [Acidobacteriota bacterium]|nr:glycine cleavage system aminomethyltransferase GcvT [Acidobacteriota bacterium]
MSETSGQTLKETPLHSEHVALNAKMVPFAGWHMPVEYSGLVAEHVQVRTSAGLFDVSHMGEIEVRGKDALSLVQRVTTNNAAKLAIKQAQYSGLIYPEGTFVDDLLVYRLAEDHFLLCVNAANTDKDFEYIQSHKSGNLELINTSDQYSQIAIQGPQAIPILQKMTAFPLQNIKVYWFDHIDLEGENVIAARTGYTGEDGFEIFCNPGVASHLWRRILEVGKGHILPAGLGARDTLRLEAKMVLYGNDIDQTTSVLEADLEWILKWDKGDFIGRKTLMRQKEAGIDRKLVGFEVTDRGIARHGHEAYLEGNSVGTVTSGTFAPFLKKAIGLVYLPVEQAVIDQEFEIDVRGKRLRARVVPTPFYKRAKSK